MTRLYKQSSKQLIILAGGIVILLILSCFFGLTLKQDKMIEQSVHLSAARLFESIILTRRWNAGYGGVFALKREGQLSNPYLKHPDIATSSGHIYTLKNPALMTREISELASENGSFSYHITSLKLMNPANQPDDWERSSLEQFEHGTQESTQATNVNGKQVYRLMRPLVVEESCLQCHSQQNYAVGQVRGGISVSLPYDEIANDLANNRIRMALLGLAIVGVFCFLFYFVIWRMVHHLSCFSNELEEQKKVLENLNADLDKKVIDRTAALQESEGQLKAMFDMASIGITQAEPITRKWVRVNQKMSEITGYTSEELLKMGVSDIIYQEDQYKDQEIFQELIQGRLQEYRMEKRYIRKDSTVVWVNVNSAIIRDAANQPVRTVSMIEDITERKRMEEERIQVETQLRQAQKMETIGHLAGGIAHDFNNILSAIIGYTEMALDEAPKAGNFHNDLSKVLSASLRAKDLVKQILTFSRQSKRVPELVDIAYIAKEAVKMLRAMIPATIAIRQKSSVSTRSRILADPTEIHQVIMNLCTNAAHAMKESGGDLDIELSEVVFGEDEAPPHPDLGPGSYIRLRVSDTGHGMSKEVLAQIFDPFFTTKVSGEGTGMGLSVLKSILKNCKAIITVESVDGDGATFYVYFPAITVEGAETAQDIKALISGKGRILFVDDEKSIADLGQKTLERLGYSVSIANNGLEAFEMIRSNPYWFDLLITDYTMPGMTGLDLTEEVKRIRPGMPVVLCSGYSDKVDEASASSFGIKAFVAKPFDRQKLSFAVNDAIQGSQLFTENHAESK